MEFVLKGEREHVRNFRKLCFGILEYKGDMEVYFCNNKRPAVYSGGNLSLLMFHSRKFVIIVTIAIKAVQ